MMGLLLVLIQGKGKQSSRSHIKTTHITQHIICCHSTSDDELIADIIRFCKKENELISVCRTSQIFQNFLNCFGDQICSNVIIAGYDSTKSGQIFHLSYGGSIAPELFIASGGAKKYICSKWESGMTSEEVKTIINTATFGRVQNFILIGKDGTRDEPLLN
uniref:Uncharacterized protein n=1 Tax=Panagrolaimus superbus TaxID=310955 RepID=A0A914ZBC9_9BILA